MILNLDRLPRVIPVGIQTEQGVESIGFDLSPWVSRWPEMTFAVWATRPGENAAYAAANTAMVGNVLYWYPNATDTEKEGAGTVEIIGVSEGKTKSSGPVDTLVKKTSLDVTQETPEPIVPWFQELLKTAGVAQQGAAEAAASADEAERFAETSAQNASDAETRAQEAKGHAETAKDHADAAKHSEDNAAAHAESAEKAKEDAVANADDAESFARDAQSSAAGAAASAASAGTDAQSASASAKAAGASAQEAQSVVQDIKNDMQGNDGKGGLYLVSVNHNVSPVKVNRAYSDIAAAIDAGDTCLLVDAREVYPCIGYAAHPTTGEQCIAFRGETKNSAQYGIAPMILYVNQDGTTYESGSYVKIPNPQKLTVKKGDTSTQYDGSAPVTVDVPDIYLVEKVNRDGGVYVNRTFDELSVAQFDGKLILLKHGVGFSWLYGYAQYNGQTCFAFRDTTRVNTEDGMAVTLSYVTPDSKLITTGEYVKIPNPNKLTFTGAVNASYDGTKPVQVEIPQGGSSIDEDYINKLVEAKVNAALGNVILPETTPEPVDEGFYITTPLSGTPEVGKVYTVTYNGTPYDCPAVTYAEENQTGVMLGNTEAIGGPGGNPDAPFVMMLAPSGSDVDGTLIYGMVMDMTGAASVTLSVVGTGRVSGNASNVFIVNVTMNSNTDGSADKSFTATKMAIDSGSMVCFRVRHEGGLLQTNTFVYTSEPEKIIAAMHYGTLTMHLHWNADGSLNVAT